MQEIQRLFGYLVHIARNSRKSDLLKGKHSRNSDARTMLTPKSETIVFSNLSDPYSCQADKFIKCQ